MNSKQRAYLRKISATIDPIFQVGKSAVTPEITAAIDEALEKREIIKLNVLKNCYMNQRTLQRLLLTETVLQLFM